MADPTHLARLLEGVEAWNKWRFANPETIPDLDAANLSHTNLCGAILAGANLQGAFLSAANLQGASLERANLQNAWLAHANLQGAKLEQTNLQGAILAGANLRDAYLWQANFRGVNLSEVDIQDVDLSGVDLQGAWLGMNQQGARLNGVNLQGTNLVRINLQSARLSGANLQSANLSAANLQGVNLEGANLRDARLMQANFREAILRRANLQGADLERANLRGAFLNEADFGDANVTGVLFDCDSRQRKFQGIRVATCHGSQMFKSFAQDQDYIDELRGLGTWGNFKFWIWFVLADCGRSFMRWTAWSLGLATLFGYIYYAMGPSHFRLDHLTFELFPMIYYSMVTFTTLGFGDIRPMTLEGAGMVMLEVILGYVMLGGLIAIFANKLARRA